MKNKQLVVEWGWENLGTFELLPVISISESELEIKWLFFYLNFFHPKENIFL